MYVILCLFVWLLAWIFVLFSAALHALISAIGTLKWYQSGLHVCIVMLIALLNSVLCAYAIAGIFIVCRTCFVSFKGIYFGCVNNLSLMVK